MIILLLLVIMFVFLTESFEALLYGRFIKDKELSLFLVRHLDEYEVNQFSGNSMLSRYHYPYIFKSWSFLSRYHFGDGYGRIPRWSRWNKVIDQKFGKQTKSLSEFLR